MGRLERYLNGIGVLLLPHEHHDVGSLEDTLEAEGVAGLDVVELGSLEEVLDGMFVVEVFLEPLRNLLLELGSLRVSIGTTMRMLPVAQNTSMACSSSFTASAVLTFFMQLAAST